MPRVNNQNRKPPLASAMEWVAKITTVALEMALPAIGGGYLDTRLGTSYWALIGVVVGVVGGMWHLLQMTRQPNSKSKRNGSSGSGSTGSGNSGSGRTGDESRSA
jgi:hypothetical protein